MPFEEGWGGSSNRASSSSSESEVTLKQIPSGVQLGRRLGPAPEKGEKGVALGFRDLWHEAWEGWPPAGWGEGVRRGEGWSPSCILLVFKSCILAKSRHNL